MKIAFIEPIRDVKNTPSEDLLHVWVESAREFGWAVQRFEVNDRFENEMSTTGFDIVILGEGFTPSHEFFKKTVARIHESVRSVPAYVFALVALPPSPSEMREWLGFGIDEVFLRAPRTPGVAGMHLRMAEARLAIGRPLAGHIIIGDRRVEKALWDAQVGLWEFHIPTATVTLSPKWERMLGFQPDATLTVEHFLASIHSDDQTRVRRAIEDAMGSDDGLYEAEYRIGAAVGGWIWALAKGAIVERDASGAPVRAVGVFVDLSEHKVLEGHLAQSQKMEAIGQLAGGIAHDFNNILTVISGNQHLLIKRLGDDDPRCAFAERSIEAVHRAADLTARLLAFARRTPLEVVNLELNEICGDALALLERVIPEKIKLTFDRASRPLRFKGDASQIVQVIVNLVVNARDAMPSGGTMTIETSLVDLDVKRARSMDLLPGEYVRLQVHDQGTGMAQETMSRIFEPFFTTKEAGKGSGLGLSIVYGITRECGGQVGVSSDLGKGSTLCVYLPAFVEAN